MAAKNLGLDIRDGFITGVIVENTIHGNMVSDFARVELFDDDSSGGNGLSRAVSMLFDELNIEQIRSGCNCYASVAPDAVFFRNVSIPFESDAKIRTVLAYEIEPLIPVPVEDLAVNHQKIKLAPNVEGTDLLVMAAEKEYLNCVVETLAENKMTPASVTTAGFPMVLLSGRYDDLGDDLVCVDFDSRYCTMYFLVSGQICFVRSFPAADNTGLEIKRSLLSFRETNGIDYFPEDVIVSGVAPDENALVQSVSEYTGLGIRWADLLSQIGVTVEDSKKMSWKPLLFDNALSIAWVGATGIRCASFYENSFTPGKYIERYKDKLIAPLVLSLILVMLLAVNLFTGIYRDGKRVEELENSIQAIYVQTFPGSRKVRHPLETMRSKVRAAEKEAEFAAAGDSSVRVVDILNEISRSLPSGLDVELTRFAVSKGKVKISGLADTFSTVDEVKNRLSKVKLFKQVVIVSSTRDKSGKLFKFRIVIDL